MIGWTLLTWPIWCCLYWLDAACHRQIKEDMKGTDEFGDGEIDEYENNVVKRIKDDKSESVKR